MADAISLSVVIPVFNREWCVERALSSACRFVARLGGGEVIVVDDGSSDASVARTQAFLLRERFEGVRPRVILLPSNRGVCAAKNAGASAATGEWLLFLDSDDELIDSVAPEFARSLLGLKELPLHFFRSVDENGAPVGLMLAEPVLRPLDDFIVLGTSGESLPVVSRSAFLRHPYDEDIQGFEGLAYVRIVRETGGAVIHPLPARRYYTSHPHRLSSRAGIRLRARSLALGYWRLGREHYRVMNLRSMAFVCSRAIVHGARAVLQ